ncbi:transporter [Desulfoluna limicola]|uniref:Transporter n=1 Tax=Desulfoluna limicola TaxID=2810562 RepID=A0ABM7PLW6_9BACT|nr:SLC13 family permease [Desulfoluna limicola]BCS98520.1 transporter [Desulfoluna limicola]
MTTDALQAENRPIDWKRLFFLTLGLGLFALVYLSPAWPDAIDPNGERFALSPEAKGAIAIFLLAGTWWVFEVLPIGITGITIGVLQVMFMVRPANVAFKDFMEPSVLFIFASLVIGMVFTKTGLTRRIAYKMLSIVGERTSMIYLGCFVITAALTHIMAHTAVAATMYPLLVTIHSMYANDREPTRFGKGLFIGMAWVAGAGSIVTLLGSARGAVAVGFFKDVVGREVDFFELSYYMFPVGWVMTFILWGMTMVLFKPEKERIIGIKERSAFMLKEMGSVTRTEVISAVIIFSCIFLLSMRSFIPALAGVDKTAIILVSTILFFVLNILDLKDLEAVPWNIILLFGGAMSIGFCLWETGAAQWLAVNWLTLFKESHWFIFVMSIAFFVLMMTNFIMNVAAIAISLPVALVIAPYLGVAPEVILFAALVTAGMPFLLLVGAAPNAIAYDSGQFTTGEFFGYGIIASIVLMVVTGIFVLLIWPMMGMPILLT